MSTRACVSRGVSWDTWIFPYKHFMVRVVASCGTGKSFMDLPCVVVKPTPSGSQMSCCTYLVAPLTILPGRSFQLAQVPEPCLQLPDDLFPHEDIGSWKCFWIKKFWCCKVRCQRVAELWWKEHLGVGAGRTGSCIGTTRWSLSG